MFWSMCGTLVCELVMCSTWEVAFRDVCVINNDGSWYWRVCMSFSLLSLKKCSFSDGYRALAAAILLLNKYFVTINVTTTMIKCFSLVNNTSFKKSLTITL